MELQGKTALITGGAHRVGKAITKMLAKGGANVIVNYNHSSGAAVETVDEAKALGVDALAIQCDVANLAAVMGMADQIREHFGGVDIIVNSASYFGKTPFPTTDPDTYAMWEQVTRISIDGPFFVCNTLVPLMQQRGGGVIVNIVDLSVWFPWPGFMAHAVGKAGLLALTQSLALELAPTIRANAIAPGLIEPPPGRSPKMIEAATKRNLLQRWSGGDAVGHAVRYLIEADFVTGEVLTVDGGERFVGKGP
ncbi:MAG TPA: SDR family oxidoreductase [Caldilineaceae bacterium]|nr:SDR family oxidoreductase [Caldilineaceae bacterium]